MVVAVFLVFLAGVALGCRAILLNLLEPEPEEQQKVPLQAV